MEGVERYPPRSNAALAGCFAMTPSAYNDMESGKATIQYKYLYGYRRGADDKPEIIPEEAEVVRWIYERYLAGASTRMLRDELHEQGVIYSEKSPQWTLPHIMTIHKSKGLEYNAVYFIGLEDSAFWNFRNQPDEDRCTFFVALSRAKASVTFTFCKKRTGMKCPMQRHNAINEFFDLLQRPGIAEVKRFQNR